MSLIQLPTLSYALQFPLGNIKRTRWSILCQPMHYDFRLPSARANNVERRRDYIPGVAVVGSGCHVLRVLFDIQQESGGDDPGSSWMG